MKKTFVFYFIFLIFILNSCSNSEIDESFDAKENYSFTYKDLIYSSPYYKINDSILIFEDKEVEKVYNKLMDFPELVTLIHEDGSIEYFECPKEMEEKENEFIYKNGTKSSKTKEHFKSYRLGLFDNYNTAYNSKYLIWEDDIDPKGTSFLISISELDYLYTPDFGYINLDKRISSFYLHLVYGSLSAGIKFDRDPNCRLYYAYISFYENTLCRGKSLVFRSSENATHIVGYLYEIGENDLRKYKWDNKARSVKVYIY